MIDVVGEEANALAREIYDTLLSVAFMTAPLRLGEQARNAEGEQVRNSVIRCIRKIEETLEIPQDKRFPQ